MQYLITVSSLAKRMQGDACGAGVCVLRSSLSMVLHNQLRFYSAVTLLLQRIIDNI